MLSRFLLQGRYRGMDAPEAAARKHEISPDQKRENSGGNEHLRYCTAPRDLIALAYPGQVHGTMVVFCVAR